MLFKLGEKLIDEALGLFGKTFSIEDEAGETTQVWAFSPASCALSALMGLAGLPSGACVGIQRIARVHETVSDSRARHRRRHGELVYIAHLEAQALETRKPEELVLHNRPPAVAPNCSMVAGVTPPGLFPGK